MVPARRRGYNFNPASIVDLRQRLGLSQRQMASRLGIPQNSLSRWERGATTPDAESLAAIYSVGAEEGILPKFFAKETVKEPVAVRDVALVYWDIQNLAPSYSNAAEWDAFIRSEVHRRVPKAKRILLKAFSSTTHQLATNELEKKEWRVWEDHGDWDEDIYDQAMSDAGQSPRHTVVFLVTADGDYADMVEELRNRGVRVYLIAPSTASKSLISAVGEKRWIREGGPLSRPPFYWPTVRVVSVKDPFKL